MTRAALWLQGWWLIWPPNCPWKSLWFPRSRPRRTSNFSVMIFVVTQRGTLVVGIAYGCRRLETAQSSSVHLMTSHFNILQMELRAHSFLNFDPRFHQQNQNLDNFAVCHFPILQTVSVLWAHKRLCVKQIYFHLSFKTNSKKLFRQIRKISMWTNLATSV